MVVEDDAEVVTFLSKEQAALFILFQQHYDNIAYLLSKQVFDTAPGNIVLSFDNFGRIKSIKKETFEYRK